MRHDRRASRRTWSYGLLSTCLVAFWIAVSGSSWRGSTELHTAIETIATLTALMVGVIALVRFYSRKDNIHLFVGCGFVGTAFLDGYHAVVTSSFFGHAFPSPPPSLIPWSWSASRTFLAAAFVLGWLVQKREQRQDGASRISENLVYLAVGALTIGAFLLFAFFPLPQAYYNQLIFGRPQEFVAAGLFLSALVGLLREGRWKRDDFEHYLVMCLIVGVIAQALFMSRSFTLFDAMFDAAHLLKVTSYVLVLVGLLCNTYHLFEGAVQGAEQVLRLNEALQREVSERLGAEYELRELNQLLERRVDQRTRELELKAKQLRTSQQQLQAILESTTAVIYVKDKEGRYLLINRRFEQLFGISRNEIIGKSDYDLFPKDMADVFRANDQAVIQQRTPIQLDETVSQTDGLHTYVSVKVPLFDPGGVPYAICGVSTDVTERKKAEERLRIALQAAPTAMLMVDESGTIALTNGETERLFGYNREELLGQQVEVLVPARYRGSHPAHRRSFFEAPQARRMGAGRELLGVRKDGTEFPVDVQLCTIETDQGRFALAGVADLTERMSAQRAQLERAKAVEYARGLERSNRDLQDFAYVASHDLQEPLRKVQMFGDFLMTECGEQLGEAGSEYLERIRNATARMQRLINDLLTFSRVTTKAKPFVPIDLSQVASEVVSDLEARLMETQGHVEVGELCTIDADATQMRQLLQNLISNALKFHRAEEPPVVKVWARLLNKTHSLMGEFPPDGICQIVVEDNGIGFEQKYAQRIFAPFKRLHGRHEYEGMGIGLAVCRKIVERHGGSIVAESTPGQGAKFVISLPVVQVREEGQTCQSETDRSPSSSLKTMPMIAS